MVMLVILSEAKDLTMVREVPYFARNDSMVAPPFAFRAQIAEHCAWLLT